MTIRKAANPVLLRSVRRWHRSREGTPRGQVRLGCFRGPNVSGSGNLGTCRLDQAGPIAQRPSVILQADGLFVHEVRSLRPTRPRVVDHASTLGLPSRACNSPTSWRPHNYFMSFGGVTRNRPFFDSTSGLLRSGSVLMTSHRHVPSTSGVNSKDMRFLGTFRSTYVPEGLMNTM